MVIANDKGYELMIEHAVALGFEVRREGYDAAKKTVLPKKAAAIENRSLKKEAVLLRRPVSLPVCASRLKRSVEV